MRRVLVLIGVTVVGAFLFAVGSAAGPSDATAVADSELEYQLCGRVFADPHAYWPSPTQAPARSPWAKGNAVCAATDFISYGDMVSGLTFLEALFPAFVEFQRLEEDFGTSRDCATTTDLTALCSAGLPRQGVPTPSRVRSDLYMVRVTDERVPDAGKKYFVFPLAIHGIERAGAEAGVRAAEDLATWGFCEAVKNAELPANPAVDCAKEGAIPHPLLEAQASESLTVGEVLRQSVVYFVFPNPDGWRRGDPDNIARFYQRYNGNGVDLNRDWPTVGFTHRPYTPWSEPETRGFGQVLKQIKSRWDGGIDLHGQLIDRAFSFTLMGASERNYSKDQRILQTVKGAWSDAEARLAWSPHIKPNDAPATCVGSPVGGSLCDRMYGVQWGTVWDTINYTVTGALGDWIDSDIGLGADGIDNEMSFSHLINCGTGTCYEPVFEQMHVDGNKSLVYAMINFSLLPEDTTFGVPGRVGYVFDPKVVSNPGSGGTSPPTAGLSPQAPIQNVTLDPSNNYRYQFTVEGPEDGVYNGGLEGKLTQLNLGGISGASVASLVLERRGGEPTPQDGGCGAAGDDWIEVNRYFNQASTYAQAGQAVHADSPEPGRWRICLTSTGAQLSGAARLDISFSTEKIWPNPGQLPYSVTNMKFFTDLAENMAPGQLTPVNAADVLSGATKLGGYSSLVIADNPSPGVGPAQQAAWGAKLREFVEDGGNLVLTDGALQALSAMDIVPAGQVARSFFYAGYIAFTNNGGGTATYDDPLAENVNQPGAAEGAGHRHQTYEPVPIGMDIGARTSCSGVQCTAPVWTVNQTAWQNAGGRTIGQSVNGRASFGELELGKGVVRIVGALLPMPTDQYYHPFGLANYAVTYTGYQVLKNTLQWERQLPDLTLSASDISLSSEKVVGGDRVTITATVHNVGTVPAGDVEVRFTDNGEQIGEVQTISSLSPDGTGTAQVVWSTKRLKGERTIEVTVDPANAIAELDEFNNSASGVVTVRGNKVQNGSFEESSNGSSPDGWSSSGSTSYAQGGSDGERSVTAGLAGSWTSDPIAVEAGKAYGVSVEVAGAGGAIVVEQLSATGVVLASVSQLLPETTEGVFQAVTRSFTAGDGVTAVRVRLAGGLSGVTTFDDVRLWEE